MFSFLLMTPATFAQADSLLNAVFQIQCEWAHSGSVDQSGPAPEFPNGIAFSSSSKPSTVNSDMELGGSIIEIKAVGGTRHFVVKDIGGALAGMFVTVYENGLSTRTETYRIEGKLAVHSYIGTCEIVE